MYKRQLLPPLIKRLSNAGIRDQDITIVFAMGIHRNHSEPEKRRLVGSEVYQRYKCVDSSEGQMCIRDRSSHDMKVIQDVCSRVIIISGGSIVADESIDDLLSLFRTRNYKIVVSRNGNLYDSGPLVAGIRSGFPQAEITETRDLIEIAVDFKNPFEIYELIETLRDAGAPIETIAQEQVDLEKAFLKIVRRENEVCG